MVDVQNISVVIAAASVVIGVMNSIYSSRIQERQRQTEIETRQAQLFMQIYDHFFDPEFLKQFGAIVYAWDWKNWDDFYGKYGPVANLEAYGAINSACNFLEGLGVLIERKLVDVSMVDDLLSYWIVRFYEKVDPVIKGAREDRRAPQLFSWAEYVYNEMRRREQLETASR